jgi:hypothetical protein
MMVVACIHSSAFGQSGGLEPAEPIPFTTFQENLWHDLWEDVYVEGVDGLLSLQSASDSSHIIHRLEWDESTSILDGAAAAATLTQVDLWEMDWYEEPGEPVSIPLGDGTVWEGMVALDIYAFSGQISSGVGYDPFIFGIVWELEIATSSSGGGAVYTYSLWTPLGRGTTIAAAEGAAEQLASEISAPPAPLTIDHDDCMSIYLLRRDTAFNDYQIDMNACGGGGLGGGIGGAAVGVGIGIYWGPDGAAAGAAVVGVIGAAIERVTGRASCIQDVKDAYNKRNVRDWNCLQQYLIANEWSCS